MSARVFFFVFVGGTGVAPCGQNGPPETANKLRTPPLWGLRTHDRLMHDGLSLTRSSAILRHQGEASGVIFRYRFLSPREKQQLDAFLSSL